MLPPDLVTRFTTPPLKRPYSAETPPTDTVVSWMASSIYRGYGVPRRFSVIATPFTINNDSNELDPAIEYAPLGPVAWTAGACSTDAFTSRVVGRVAMRS